MLRQQTYLLKIEPKRESSAPSLMIVEKRSNPRSESEQTVHSCMILVRKMHFNVQSAELGTLNTKVVLVLSMTEIS